MFAVFGAAGQFVYNKASAENAVSRQTNLESTGEFSWTKSKWSPVKVLSDAEYEDMLQEKLLRVNAEIALLDDNIEALRAQERDMATRVAASTDKR